MKLYGKIGKVVVCVIIISVLISVLLASSRYQVALEDGSFDEDEWTSTPYVASTYTGSAQISSSGIITETTSEELWNQMIENKNNIEHYLDSPEELEKLMNAEIITQYPKIDNADEGALNGIIEFQRNKTDGTSTTLTYMNKDTFDSYINSNSNTTSDGNSILNYFTLDNDGNVIVAVINTETYKIESNDNNISIESLTNEGIDVVNLTEDNKNSEGTYYNEVYNVESKTINYKSMIQNYTMPFQYLWALLVVGEDKDFVLELADLVEDSEITISLYDNIATTEYEDVYTYKKETRIDKYAKISVDNDYGVTGYLTERYWLSDKSPEPDIKHYTPPFYSTYVTDENEYNVTMTKICKTNSFVYDLTKANVWVVNYSKDYEYLAGSTEKEENSKGLDNTEYVFDKDTSRDSNADVSLLQDSDALSFAASMKSYIERKAEENKKESTESDSDTEESTESDSDTEEEIEVNVTVSYVRYKNYIHKIERKQNSTVLKTNQKYVEGDVVNDPKVDINADEDNPNFVSILNKSSHKNAKYQLTGEITSWLIEILKTNTDTENMVDLTKYLLYKATGNDSLWDSDEEYDFSEFEYNKFSSTGSEGNGLSLTEPTLDKESFIAAMKAYAGKNKNFDSNFLPYSAEIYDWSVESGVNPELVVITACTEQSFKAPSNAPNNYWGIAVYTEHSVGKGYSSLRDGIIAYADLIKSYGIGGSNESMVMDKYNRRKDSGCNPLGYGLPGTLSGMQSLYSAQDNTTHETGKTEYGNYLLNCVYRGSQADYKRLCLDGGSEHADTAVFTPWEAGEYTAWQVEQKIEHWNEFFGNYGSLASGGNSNIIETAKSKLGCPYVYATEGPDTFDCSGLVKWVYKQHGINNVPRSTGEYEDYIGSQYEVSLDSAQPGDILIVLKTERNSDFGHAAIYLGDDSYIHAPQTGDVVKIEKSGAKTKFKHAFRFY